MPIVNSEAESRKRRIPQQVRSRERVERLLDAAAGLVVARGVENLSTRAIAEAADVPVASLYQYFADRDEILLALVERDVQAMHQQVREDLAALTAYTLPRVAEAITGAVVKVLLRRPAFVFVWLRGRTNPAIQEYGRAHNRRVAQELHRLAGDLGLLGPTAELLHTELAVELGDRLLQIAFESDPTGDRAVLEEAVRVVARYLAPHATVG